MFALAVVAFLPAWQAAAQTPCGLAPGLVLYTLVGAESTDWKTTIAVPVLVDDRWIKSAAYGISTTGPLMMTAGDPSGVPVFRANGTRIGLLRDLLCRLWNDSGISHEPGVHKVRLDQEPTFFRDENRLYQVFLDAPRAR